MGEPEQQSEGYWDLYDGTFRDWEEFVEACVKAQKEYEEAARLLAQ